jgi:hypothetical protein
VREIQINSDIDPQATSLPLAFLTIFRNIWKDKLAEFCEWDVPGMAHTSQQEAVVLSNEQGGIS